MLPELADALSEELDQLAAQDRLRDCPPYDGASRVRAALEGQSALSFCSNDYLGLASHPALPASASRAAALRGFGAGGSRLVSGDFPEHRALETALARFFQRPAALYFPTGYQTNLGVVTALAGRADLIVSDAANHASLIDGCRLSRATVRVYPHRDAAAAARALHDGASDFRRRFLLTESLFSMDGDVAPLPALAEAARSARAALIVDEAHAVGALGPGGRGLCAAAGLNPDVLIGTLGKAFGALGGFVVGSAVLRRYLVNRARTFLFTTAPPPALAAAGVTALEIAAGEEGDRRRTALAERIEQLATALGPAPALASTLRTPIHPLVLGPDRAALSAAANLRDRGILVQPIRPPTVPEGTARLRITLSAGHEAAHVERLLAALRELPTASART